MVELLESAITSPWAYLVLVIVAMLDAFFPIVPAETMVIAAGVFAAATGKPDLLAVIALAALGAFLGDHISYQIGARAGTALIARARPGSRRRAPFDWAAKTLAARGGLLLVVARYVPGGRTAVTLTAGAVGYPRGRFALFDAIGATLWAVYAAMVGYLGGAVFEENALKGLALGLGLAFGLTALVEASRYLLRLLRSRSGGRGDGQAGDRAGSGWLRRRRRRRRASRAGSDHVVASGARRWRRRANWPHRWSPRRPAGRGTH